MSDEPTLADELEVMLGTGPEAVDWADWEGWSRRAITRIAELEAENAELRRTDLARALNKPVKEIAGEFDDDFDE